MGHQSAVCLAGANPREGIGALHGWCSAHILVRCVQAAPESLSVQSVRGGVHLASRGARQDDVASSTA